MMINGIADVGGRYGLYAYIEFVTLQATQKWRVVLTSEKYFLIRVNDIMSILVCGL